jgi:choline dehydrogenase-like flavoprotein
VHIDSGIRDDRAGTARRGPQVGDELAQEGHHAVRAVHHQVGTCRQGRLLVGP